MMSDADFKLWCEYHMTALNLWVETWAQTLLTFRDSLASADVTVAEAKAATHAIRLLDSCDRNDPGWQLRQLLASIHCERSAAVRELVGSGDANTDPRGECEECRGTGLVIVPHTRCVPCGEWIHPFWTMVVTCRCPLGNWKQERMQDHKKRKPLTIGNYADRNPHWRQQVVDRDRHIAAVTRAHSVFAAKGADLIRRMTRGIGEQVGRGRDAA